MATTSAVNVSGTWKDLVNGTAVNVSGTWKTVTEIFVNVSGTWKSAWTNGVVGVSGQSVSDSTAAPGTATAGVRFNDDGTVDQNIGTVYSQIDSATDWIIPNAVASGTYSIRATEVSAVGSPLTKNGTMNTWQALSSDREWSAVRAGASVGTSTWTITIEISDDGGSTVLDSANYILEADLA